MKAFEVTQLLFLLSMPLTSHAAFLSPSQRRLSGWTARHHTAIFMSDDDDTKDDFYRDLQKAKNEKLGSPIPKEQLKESAQESEQEFLAAMKKTSEEFQAAKEALGSTGAVDLFLGKIQKEEQAEKSRQEHDDDDDDEDE